MYIKRILEKNIKEAACEFCAIAILGPRQSGKTTLALHMFPEHKYISLEDYDKRERANLDPKGFLNEYPTKKGLILDEIQHVPKLLSYIQTIIDIEKKKGFFYNNRLSFKGFYPIIYGKNYDSTEWYTDYIKNYLESDVRTLLNISNLIAFKNFLKLCAGFNGQLVNYSALANACGISYNTAKSWLSVLQASYIIFLLPSHYKNFKKRLVKAPKLYFYDTGLARTLVDIDDIKQIKTYHNKGTLFESMIISDLFKEFYNHDKVPHLYFWCDHTGNEVDCLIEKSTKLYPIEIKMSNTLSHHFFNGLKRYNDLSSTPETHNFVVYGGTENQKRSAGTFIGWNKISEIFTKI